MNGRAILGAWAIRPLGRVAAGAADALNSICVSHGPVSRDDGAGAIRVLPLGSPNFFCRRFVSVGNSYLRAALEPGSHSPRKGFWSDPRSGRLLHAHEHGEAEWKVLRERLREKVAEYGA